MSYCSENSPDAQLRELGVPVLSPRDTMKRHPKVMRNKPQSHPLPLPELPCLPRGRGRGAAESQPSRAPVWAFRGSRSGVCLRRALERTRSDITDLLVRQGLRAPEKGRCQAPQPICVAGEKPALYLSLRSTLSPLTSRPLCQKTFITVIAGCAKRATLLHWGPICSPRDVWQCLEPYVLSRLRGEVLLASRE